MIINNKLEIKLLSINQWEEILSLSVSKNQIDYIETSEKCLEDAKNDAYDIKWNFYGVYLEQSIIGFAMFGVQRLKVFPFEQVWLDRFVIDEKFQGKGYGKNSLQLIIDNLYRKYENKKIYLSVYEENVTATELYLKLGFKKTRFKEPTGERIMTRKYSSDEDKGV